MARRILVTGGRDFDDIEQVETFLLAAAATLPDVTQGPLTVVHGDCKRYLSDGRVDPTRSADQLAAHVAERMGWEIDPHPVLREEYGRLGPLAPLERNTRMVLLGADICVVFPGGDGTRDCERKARYAGIPVMKLEPAQ